MADVLLPPLGDTVDEARVTGWLKQIGDVVAIDEPLITVETDKVETEIPSLVAGVLIEHRATEGDTVPVGAVLGVVQAEAAASMPDDAATVEDGLVLGAAPVGPPASSPDPVDVGTTSARPAAAPSGRLAPRSDRVRSPLVRRLLVEHRLDPSRIQGSGPGGRITRADVLANAGAVVAPAAAAAAVQSSTVAQARIEPSLTTATTPAVTPAVTPAARLFPDDPHWQPFSRIRKVTGERMLLSATTIPQVTTVMKVDYDNVDRARQVHKAAFRERTGRSLTYLPFVSLAVVNALAEFPLVNATVKGDGLIVHPPVHLGIAVDLDFRGLVVPVVRNAQELRLEALAARVGDLAERARDKKLGADDLSGSTFTITNPGGYGTLAGTPLVNPPEVAILCLEGISDEAVAVRTSDGSTSLAIHPIGHLSLSWDHRAMDGAYAAAFLAKIRSELEQRDWSALL